MGKNISEEQYAELLEVIVSKCQSLGLSPSQSTDGLSRSLLGILEATNKSSVNVVVESIGTVKAELS